MQRFEIIDHTADIGIRSYGNDLSEAFANSAYGMFSLMADLEGLGDDIRREIEVDSYDQEALLVTWLNELLYLFDVEHIIFNRFEIINLSKKRLQAIAYGETIDLSRHDLKTSIKAATYHMLMIEKNDEGFKTQVILDI